jgi:hypothetical protein
MMKFFAATSYVNSKKKNRGCGLWAHFPDLFDNFDELDRESLLTIVTIVVGSPVGFVAVSFIIGSGLTILSKRVDTWVLAGVGVTLQCLTCAAQHSLLPNLLSTPSNLRKRHQ